MSKVAGLPPPERDRRSRSTYRSVQSMSRDLGGALIGNFRARRRNLRAAPRTRHLNPRTGIAPDRATVRMISAFARKQTGLFQNNFYVDLRSLMKHPMFVTYVVVC